MQLGRDLRGKEERHERCLAINFEPGAPSAFHFFGEVLNRFLIHCHPLTAAERHLSLVHSRENFAAAPFALLPELEGFPDGVLRTRDPAIFNGLANESLLIGAKIDSHGIKRRLGERPCQV
jgi:hypothetical protein